MEEKSRRGGFCGWFIVLIVVAVIVGAVVYGIKKKSGKSHGGEAAPVPGPPGAIAEKYSSALKLAVQFFDVQKSGKLVDNKVPWRGDSALDDGKSVKADLSKGMYDAGDHMKFAFPMAYTATILAWSVLEYGDQMESVEQLQPVKDSLKWITDFLIEAHPSPNVIYIQVGDPKIDHGCWNRPEDMKEKRPVVAAGESKPGADVAGEMAAAMAAASMVFKEGDGAYSETLVKHAKQLFRFADDNPALYSDSFPDAAVYYNSTGYGDELLWAATWLYHATGEDTYLKYLTGEKGNEFAQWGSPTWFSWDNKLAGVQVLLSRLTFFRGKTASNSGLLKYRSTAEAVMCGLVPQSPTATKSRTKSGLIWVSEWNSLQHPVAAAFLASLYADYMLSTRTASFSCNGKLFSPSDLKKFARSQADYVLGDNPMKISYVVGYGDKYPQYVHHRGSSIPASESPACKAGWKWLTEEQPNPNIAYGAIVGGPFLNETFIDSRNNSMQVEPTTYSSAVLVGLLSGIVTSSSAPQSLS